MEHRQNIQQQERMSTSEKVRVLLREAVFRYETDMAEATAKPRVSTYEVGRIDDAFNASVEQLRRVSLRHDDSLELSALFMHEALSEDSPYTRYGRAAAVNIGMSFSGSEHNETRAQIAKAHYVQAVTDLHRGDTAAMERAEAAHKVLGALHYEVEMITVPSHAQDFVRYSKDRAGDMAEYAQKNARKTAVAGAGVLLVTGIVTPSMAQAAEPLRVSTVATTDAEVSTSAAPAVAVVAKERIDKTAPLKLSTATALEHSAVVDIAVAMQSEKTAVKPLSLGFDTTNEQKTGVPKISVETKKAETKAQPLVLNEETTPPVRSTAIAVAVPQLSPADASAVKEHSQLAVATSHNEAPTQKELAGMTKEQKMIVMIRDAIDNETADTSMNTAASLIRLGFHVSSEQSVPVAFGETKGDDTLYNAVIDRQLDLQDTLEKNGHADANYVNNALLSLAVLEVVSEDQSVLNAPDVQKLIADIKKPADEYQGKLFDQYLAKAKEALGADDGKLLSGIDERFHAQVETLYAYSLMSIASDDEQATQIKGIKDAEAEAAAEKKAAEEAAAAAKAAEAANGGDISSEAIKTLIDNAPSQTQKNGFYIMQFFMNNGYSSAQAAAIVGNLANESGLIPDRTQMGGGPGRGLAQWEVGGRFDLYLAFAQERGKPWTDMDTQLEFLLHEMQTSHKLASDHIKGAVSFKGAEAAHFDGADEVGKAAYSFMRFFEVPAVVIKGLNGYGWNAAFAEGNERSASARQFFDAFNHQVDAIKQARAEAEARNKAEQEKREQENGMNLQQAIQFVADYKNDPNNVQYTGEASQQCNGGPLSNCVSFSVYFANKYTNIGGMGKGAMPGNGSIVVQNIAARNPNIKTGHTPEVNAIFSTPSGTQMCGHVKCGHTGIILGVDKARGVVIVGEAGCGTEGWWDTAREYSYDRFNSEMYTYAYTDGWLKAEVK